MRSIKELCFILALTGTCFAQQWEVGGAGGFGIFKNASVSGNGQSGDAGFSNSAAVSAFAVQDLYKHLGGEIGYTFQFDGLTASSGGAKETFAGQSHAIYYNVLYKVGDREAQIQPYLAAGGGVKIYCGTGSSQVSQDLDNLVYLTRTQQVEPLITFGAGVKMKVSRRSFLYVEVRDYLTPFPDNVVAPAIGAKLSGWVHDFVPMVGLSFSF
jgi:hypothetical protein